MKALILKFKEKFNGFLSSGPEAQGSLDNKKIFLLIITIVTILYIDINFIIKRQIAFLNDATPKILHLKSDIDNLSRELPGVKALIAKRDLLRQQGKLRVKNIITEEKLPMLLQFISDAADKNNITIMQIRPTRQPAPKADKTGSAGKYVTVLIALNLNGSYHNIGRFINDLENAPDLITAEDLKISPDPADNYKQSIYLLVKTYVEK